MAHSKLIRKEFRTSKENANQLKALAKHYTERNKVYLQDHLVSPDESIYDVSEAQIIRSLISEKYKQLKDEGYDLK